jgi:uncharacterized ferritin-like protein (DUF455 family)
MMDATAWLKIETARQKIDHLPSVIEALLGARAVELPKKDAPSVPDVPGRDAQVLSIKLHPKKAGLATLEGQVRLLHDLGNIELQAMELAVRTLIEFPEAPNVFREELSEIALDEARHFSLCLDGIEELGSHWGALPVHAALWEAVFEFEKTAESEVARPGDLLGRVLLVHRYMEGSGLDAGARITEKLSGVNEPYVKISRKIVGTILREEIGHVSFGSRWYRELCRKREIDSDQHFRKHYPEILWHMPRTERPAYAYRTQAGFSEPENEIIRLLFEKTDFSQKRPKVPPTFW